MPLSPRTLVGLAAALCLAVCALALSLALGAPHTGNAFSVDAENRLVHAGTGQVVTHFVIDGTDTAVDGSLAIEEPDMLPTYAQYNAFMSLQSAATSALAEGRLALRLQGGDSVTPASTPREVSDLPLMFWLQVLFGVGGMMTGALVLAGRPRQLAARLYALTGLGYLVFAPAAAVYSTRELLLDGDVFRALSVANHAGALLFTGSLTALLWSYPVRLGRVPMVTILYVATFAAIVADAVQLTPEMAQYHFSVLAIFLLSFVFAAMQWWKTREAPAERAALRWFLLSIYLATGLFAGVIIIPAALGVMPPASQGVMFGAFLLMYWGLALGIVRYRLFDLAQWWRSIWWWFLGGVAIVLVDVLLISSLALSDAMALSIAVAVVGWVYFPLRQWLWSRLGESRDRTLSQWLPEVLPILIETQAGASGEEEIRARWPGALQAVFRPLSIEPADGRIEAATIRDDGLVLAVPDIRDRSGHFLLRHVEGGARLFSRQDITTLAALRELFDLALDRLRSRDAGARVERERIRRDIHDDLGAKLLTLLHSSGDPGKPLVREAIEDLRSLVRALEYEPVPLREAVDTWQAEARKRADSAGVVLTWQCGELPDGILLNPRQHANLTRVLREAVSNALRHARPAAIHVDIRPADTGLELLIRNDGDVKPLESWPTGRGRQIMQNRLAEVGGEALWIVEGSVCVLRVTAPTG